MAQEKVGAEPAALDWDLCLRCVRPLNPLQNFCPHCGAPAGYAASLPFEHKLVLAQSIGMMFLRTCFTPGVPLRWRAVDVIVLSWVAFWPFFLLPMFPIGWVLSQAAVSISLLLAVTGHLLHKLRRRRN
ncbi:MAG: hypothetical protein O7E54_08200 [Planctomycetota bacterium]|nr:hypothetical protein [Planctomycetota bacterium]